MSNISPQPQTIPERRHLDTDGAAAYLGLAPKTLANWRTSKDRQQPLPWLRIGGRVRYRQADLDAFLDAARRAA